MEEPVSNSLPAFTQDQLILARSKLWTPELDKLLRKWKNQVGKRERGHLDQNRKFSRRHYILGGPAIILSTIVSVGIFATFRNCAECDDQGAPECVVDEAIRIASGVVGLISMALTAFLTFMNYADTAADHKTAADDFGSMFRNLDTMLLVPPPVRGDPQSTLQSIRNQYDDLVRRSPTLPSKYDALLTFEVVGKGRMLKPPRPGQFPPSNITPHTTTDLRKLLSNEIKNENYSSENSSSCSAIDKISNFMAQENDYDTDEEDQEVKIAFDLDGNMNYNAASAAFAAAELASRKEQITQNSLQAALAFEMQRLDGNTFSQVKLVKEPKKRGKPSKKVSPKSSPRENKRISPNPYQDENSSSSPKQEEKSDIEIQIDDE